ncbi:MAG: alpha/beta hydrolase fold domain-containing protein [Fuerstiella sp.]
MKPNTVVTLILSAALGNAAFSQDNDTPLKRQQRPARFQQFFTIRGVEFTKEQQVKIDDIYQKFLPRLTDNQSRWDGMITEGQQRVRREAQRKAQDAGKQGLELLRAVGAAVEWSTEQLKRRTEVKKQRDQLVAEIRTQLTALLTDEQRSKLQQTERARNQNQNRISPTHADVQYGPHGRHIMDVWLAKSDQPTPVLVSIHGGGFRGGNKSVSGGLLRQCLDSGISVVAITYRFSSQAIAPASFHDSARAVQFIRHHADEWNIAPTRFAATGGSAGAGISLWLGFHDDLADPNNEDPILRHSTRLTCMMVSAGQSSYDPRFIRKLFPEFETYKHGALAQLFDVDLNRLDELPEGKYRLFEEVSPIHHLTKDDVPAMLSYGGTFDQEVTNVNIGIHHARFGKVLKEWMDALGIRCDVYAGKEVLGGGPRVSTIDFLRQQFEMTD